MARRFNVAVVTGTRAEYGLLRPVIKAISADDRLSLKLIVTGSHLVKSLGATVSEIMSDGFFINRIIDILDGGNCFDPAEAMRNALREFNSYFIDFPPDAVLVLGDRYEIFGVTLAASMRSIPVVHIAGGELTEGAKDDFYRHCITKMSSLHFTSTEVYRRRVIQLGEQPELVFNVGSLGAENIKSLRLLDAEVLSESIGFNCERPFLLATYHPETLTGLDPLAGLEEVLAAVDLCGLPVLFTKANVDEGGAEINMRLNEYCEENPDSTKLVSSLGAQLYLSAMKNCAALLGNSSSGIVEAPTLKKPSVNVGDRQSGRIMGPNTICCPTERGAIAEAIATAVSPEFSLSLTDMESPYDGGATGYRISSILGDFLSEARLSCRKRFYDIAFELEEKQKP